MTNKPIIIIGEPKTGKSFLESQLSIIYKDKIFIDGRSFTKNTKIKPISLETDLITIDDVKSINKISEFILSDYIKLEIASKEYVWYPTPQIIITSDSVKFKDIDPKLIEKCIIIECAIEEGLGFFTNKRLN